MATAAASNRNVSFKEDGDSKPAASTAPSVLCPNCGSTAVEQHEASGTSICTDCGVVVEENAIVSSVEFVEGAGGSSSMVGQFVSATSSKAYSTVRHGRYGGFSRDSRETTLANGRRRIQEVASRLRLGTHFVDAAHRLYTIAVEKNFVQGRRTAHVVAACLYISCRQEKSQHMLIDFSDALQVNVYALGTCFLKFRRLLGLKLEIVDPALYVYRFAAHLGLNDQTHAVSLTALRLVARMKRDWIVSGRRPAGICAAALLIAARAHGFTSQTAADVTRILRVCGVTVRTRVKEFALTPSARYSLQQFSAQEFLAEEADPPRYTHNRQKEARARAIASGDSDLLESGQLDGKGENAAKWRRGGTPKQKKEFETLYQSLEAQFDEEGRKGEEEQASNVANGKVGEEEESPEEQSDKKKWEAAYPRHPNGKKVVLPEESTEEERQPSTTPVQSKLDFEGWKKERPEWLDDEVDSLFRTEEEENKAEFIFNTINKDYLIQQERKASERKASERLKQEAESVAGKEDPNAQDDGQPASGKIGKKYKKRKVPAGEDERTTEEQLMATIANRKVSRKINYDALSSIFDETGNFATDLPDGDNMDDSSMYAML